MLGHHRIPSRFWLSAYTYKCIKNDCRKYIYLSPQFRAGRLSRESLLLTLPWWGAQATDPQLTSYRAQVSRRLEERYPEARVRFWDAAISGTTSQLGAYEGIVRRLVSAEVPVVQAIFAVKADVSPGARERPLDAAHEATADELWDVPADGIHPGDKGYALYAEAVWAAYEKAVTEKRVCRVPEAMLHADTYLTVKRARLSSLGALPEGWSVGKPHRGAVAFDFVMSRWADDMTIARGASM